MDKSEEISMKVGAFFNWLFELPDGQGFVFSFQPLIAALIAFGAAFLAYRAATYATKQDAINKAKYYNSTIMMIAASLVDLNERTEKVSETKKFSEIAGLLSLFHSYNMECFDYNFVAPLTSREIQYSVQIKVSFSLIIRAMEEYVSGYEKLDHEIAQGNNQKAAQIEGRLQSLLNIMYEGSNIIIKDINSSLQITDKKLK